MKVQPMYLQVSKAAKMLDCSPEYIHKLIIDGRLEAINLGLRATRVSKESLDQLISVSRIDPEKYYH